MAWGALLILAAGGVLSSCGQRNDEFVDCGPGETTLIGNERYCVYSNALIIEGFDCPVQMSYHEVPGGVVCSPNPSGQDLPGPIKDPFELDPVTGDPVQAPPGKLYPVASDPDLFGQPQPSRDVFEKIYRAKGYACAVDGAKAASCWGPKLASMAGTIPDVLTDVEHMALAEDALCVLDASGDATCHGEVTWTLPATPHDYRHISLHDDGVFCGLKASTSALECVGDGELFSLLEREGFANAGKSFSSFDVRRADVTDLRSYACGVLGDGRIECVVDGERAVTDGAHLYTDVATLYDASSDQVRLSGLLEDGEVDLWYGVAFVQGPSSWFSLEDSPRFETMYSAYCGKRQVGEEVVCWGEAFAQPATSRFTTTLRSGTRTMAQSWDASGVRWCAISSDGELECSGFSL